MTVSELIAMLKRCTSQYDTDPEVLLASDSEGNSFHLMDTGCSLEMCADGNDVLILYPSDSTVDLAD